MADIEAIKKQIQQRRQALATARKQTEAQKVRTTQRELRRGLGVKGREERRERKGAFRKVKKEQLGKIERATEEFEKQVKPAEQQIEEYEKQQARIKAFEHGRKMAVQGKGIVGLSKLEREGYRAGREELSAFKQRKESLKELEKEIGEITPEKLKAIQKGKLIIEGDVPKGIVSESIYKELQQRAERGDVIAQRTLFKVSGYVEEKQLTKAERLLEISRLAKEGKYGEIERRWEKLTKEQRDVLTPTEQTKIGVIRKADVTQYRFGMLDPRYMWGAYKAGEFIPEAQARKAQEVGTFLSGLIPKQKEKEMVLPPIYTQKTIPQQTFITGTLPERKIEYQPTILKTTTKTIGTLGTGITTYAVTPMRFLGGAGASAGAIRRFWEGDVKGGLTQTGLTALYFAPEIIRGGKKVLPKTVSRSYRELGLTKAELKELRTAVGTRRYYELRLKALRHLEKKGDVTGIQAFQRVVPYTKPLGYVEKEAAISAIAIQRYNLMGGEVGRGLPETVIKKPMKFLGKGEKVLTKTEVTRLAKEIKGVDIYATERQLVRAVKEMGVSKQKVMTRLPKRVYVQRGITESGIPLLEARKLPALRYSPFIGRTERDIFGLSRGVKTKEGTRILQFLYTKGARGRPIGVETQLTLIPKEGKYAEILTLGRTRKSVQVLKRGELTFKKYIVDPLKIKEAQIVKLGKTKIVPLAKTKEGRVVFREYGLEFKKLVSFRPKKLEPIQLLKEIKKPTPTKELGVLFRKGTLVERQRIGEVTIPKRGEVTALQTGLKKVSFPEGDKTLYLAKGIERLRRFTRIGIGYGKGYSPIGVKQIDITTLPRMKIGRAPIQTSKYLKHLYQQKEIPIIIPTKTKLPIPRIKIPSPRVGVGIDYSTLATPRMVGGLGIIKSPYYGKGVMVSEEVTYAKQLPSITGMAIVQEPQLITRQKDIQETKLKIIPIEKQRPLEIQARAGIERMGMRPKLKGIQVPKLRTELLQKQIQKQKLLQLIRAKEGVRPKPQIRPQPTIIPRKTIIPSPPGFEIETSRIQPKEELKEAFEVFTRRRGEDIPIGEFRTLRKAKVQLAKELKGTLRASGFIEREGEKLEFEELGELGEEFIPSKIEPFRVVQKKEKRLSALPEVKEIQFFKKRKGKKMRFI